MNKKINWADSYEIVLKIKDLSISYSYSEPREKTDHKCFDYIMIFGEIIFSSYKPFKKGDELKLNSSVDHDDEIKGLDDKIFVEDGSAFGKSMTIREFREQNRVYKIVGAISRFHKFITTDDRFWDRYSLMKLHNKDVYLYLECRREFRKRELKIMWYKLMTEFDIKDYE